MKLPSSSSPSFLLRVLALTRGFA